MWLLTTFGMYSIVRKNGDALLTIRARVRKDLVLLRSFMPALSAVLDTHGASDYPYRCTISPGDFACGVAKIGAGIDYDNFKGAVARLQGHDRASIYTQLWATLRQLERLDAEGRARASDAGETAAKGRTVRQRRRKKK